MIIDPDQKTIKIRQSWLDTATRCPEEGRLAVLNPDLGVTTDEAVLGTGAHWAIEQVIEGNLDPADIAHGVEYFFHHVNEEEYRFVKRASLDEIIAVSSNCADAWVRDIMPHVPLDGAVCEHHFDVQIDEVAVPPGKEIPEGDWAIHITGTADLAPKVDSELWDWKTSGRSYSQKDKQKWAVQPTIYAAAAVLGGFPDDVTYTWPTTFKYGVMVKLAKTARGEITTVQRTQNHWDWVHRKIKSFVDLAIHFGFNRPWPMIDEKNFLCSATWCDFYSSCRGASIPTSDDLFGYNPK